MFGCCKNDEEEELTQEEQEERNQRFAIAGDAFIKSLGILVVIQLLMAGKRLDNSDDYARSKTSWMITFIPLWLLLVCLFVLMARWIRSISDIRSGKRRNSLNIIWTLCLAFIIFPTASLYLSLENCDALSENRLQILIIEDEHQNDTYEVSMHAWPDDDEKPGAYVADISDEYVPIPLPHSWTGCAVPLMILFGGIVLWAFFDLLTNRTLEYNAIRICCYKDLMLEEDLD